MAEVIFGLILAGGQGRRMGGVDKAQVLLGARPLLSHVTDRLAPQVGVQQLFDGAEKGVQIDQYDPVLRFVTHDPPTRQLILRPTMIIARDAGKNRSADSWPSTRRKANDASGRGVVQ